MLNNEYSEILEQQKSTNPELYKILISYNQERFNDISNASHSIQNMISFINCSYQFINEAHPEAKSYEFWSDIQSELSQLIDYINHANTYRYSFYEPELKIVNLHEMLHSLPDTLDASAGEAKTMAYELTKRQWNYDLDPLINNVVTDRYQLKTALLELLRNGLEASPSTSPITIRTKLLNSNTCTLSVSYHSTDTNALLSHSQDELVKPFFTTKAEHAGLGLSIVDNICRKLKGHFFISLQNDTIINQIELPI